MASKQDVTDDLKIAFQFQQAGQADRAKRLYRRILKRHPSEPNALHLLGVLAYERGRPGEAVHLIEQAQRLIPTSPEIQTNYANALRAVGKLTEAEAAARHAITLKPDMAHAYAILAQIYNDKEQYDAAVKCAEQAIQLDPRDYDAHAHLGYALGLLDRWEASGTAFQASLRIKPEQPLVLSRLGIVLSRLLLHDAAMVCHRNAVKFWPDDADLHLAMSKSQMHAQDVSGAAKSARRALDLNPQLREAWMLLGGALSALGRFDEATAAAQELLRLDPTAAEAFQSFSNLGRPLEGEAELERLRALLDQPDLPTARRVVCEFTLAERFDQLQRYDEAFPHLAAANRLLYQQRAERGERFDADLFDVRVDEIIAACSAEFYQKALEWGNPSELPVFIIGMPRSGTTMVEQIAASHPSVFGAGELKDLGQIARRLMVDNAGRGIADWDPIGARRLADAHIGKLKTLGRTATRVIDKMPDNVFAIGVGAALFSRARVILCHRDLRDVCLSCYFQNFAEGQTFAMDPLECGRRGLSVERLMDHWRRVLRVPMLEIQYESLVADLEGTSRRLIEFLGLDWDPACLEFHRTRRQVVTASNWQVRQPLYARSVGRWRNYQRHLGPLLDLLGRGDDPVGRGIGEKGVPGVV